MYESLEVLAYPLVLKDDLYNDPIQDLQSQKAVLFPTTDRLFVYIEKAMTVI